MWAAGSRGCRPIRSGTDAVSAERFGWADAADVLAEVAASDGPFALTPSGRAFASAGGVRVVPPLVLPWRGLPPFGKRAKAVAPTARELAAARAREGAHGCALAAYVAELPDAPPLYCVLLMQAGAASIGVFDGNGALATKSLKRYVVRGKGHAQGTHLKTKGKSRYGSRLRLQNTRLMYGEVHAKLADYRERFGAPELAFVSAPERLWSDFTGFGEWPAFGDSTRILGVPHDVPVPVTDVLLDVERRLRCGVIERGDVG